MHILPIWILNCQVPFPCLAPVEAGKDIGSLGTEVTDSCEPPWDCWELYLGPMEEQSVLTTAEPSFQSPSFSYKGVGWFCGWKMSIHAREAALLFSRAPSNSTAAVHNCQQCWRQGQPWEHVEMKTTSCLQIPLHLLEHPTIAYNSSDSDVIQTGSFLPRYHLRSVLYLSLLLLKLSVLSRPC